MPAWFWSTVVGAVPLFGGFLLWWQTRPQVEESRAVRLRRNLRVQIRIRIAQNLCTFLPVKESETTDEDFLAQVSVNLIEYMSRQQGEMTDLLRCELLYDSFIRANRTFKWLLLFLSIVISSLVIGSRICFDHDKAVAGFILLLLVGALGIFACSLFAYREVKKDRFNDLCAKYEVCDEKTSEA